MVRPRRCNASLSYDPWPAASWIVGESAKAAPLWPRDEDELTRLQIALSAGELGIADRLGDLISIARELSAEGLELWYPKNVDDGDVDAVREQLGNMHVAAVGTPAEFGREDSCDQDRRLLLRALQVAAELDCPYVNTYFGWRERRDDAAATRAFVANIAACVREAEQLKITITLENEFDAFGHDGAGSDPTRRPRAARTLVEEVGSEAFLLTFDPCNALFAGVDPLAMYEELSHLITYVHVKDGRRVGSAETSGEWSSFRDSGQSYQTCPLGEGEVPWRELLAKLLERGYDGFVTLEPHAKRAHHHAAWRQAVPAFRSLMESQLSS